MLSQSEIVLYALVIPLLPLIAYSLMTGSKAPEQGLLAKYYAVEKNLNLVGNLFVLTVCASAIARLSIHFGYMPTAVESPLVLAIGAAFGALNLTYLALWIRAILKVRRISKAQA